MSADSSSTVGIAVRCIACEGENPSSAKFCEGCGHAIYEPCGECSAATVIGQKFCGQCGSNLHDFTKRRWDENESRLRSAVDLAKQAKFDDAIGRLRLVAQINDHRFRTQSRSAGEAIDRIEVLRDKTVSISREKMAAARTAFEQGRRDDVLRLLKGVPDHLLDDDVRTAKAQSETFLVEVRSVESEFKAAIEKKDYRLSGALVNQLHQLLPDNTRYRRTGDRIAEKLLAKANEAFKRRRYNLASGYLESIPGRNLTDSIEDLRLRIVDAKWLHETIDAEPYADENLGRLAKRFAEMVPDDPRGSETLRRIATERKRPIGGNRILDPVWTGSRSSWIGGDFHPLQRCQTIVSDVADRVIERATGQFGVAIGLAIQALGQSRIGDDFGIKRKSLFKRKSATAAYGCDVGTHGVRFVRLESKDGTVRLTDARYLPYPELTGPIAKINQVKLFKPIAERIAAEFDLADAPVWVNLPAGEIATRFVRLPPLPDKKVNDLLDQEIRDRIPIDRDELVIVTHVAPYSKDDTHGRAAVISAARKRAIESRLAVFEAVGIKPDGIQADPVALVNFVAHEFADELGQPQLGVSDGDPANHDAAFPTLAIIDAGAASTTLLFVSAETHWFWTVEVGGDDLTTALVRPTRLTHAAAELLKNDPVKLEHVGDQFQAVETKMDDLRARLRRLADDAKRQNDRFAVIDCWCLGGSAKTHGWMRRVMGESEPE